MLLFAVEFFDVVAVDDVNHLAVRQINMALDRVCVCVCYRFWRPRFTVNVIVTAAATATSAAVRMKIHRYTQHVILHPAF